MTRRILNGWKEISAHIERGVRTAQRWEATLGMPVHRPALKDRSAVVAFSDELDRWLSRGAPDEKNDAESSTRSVSRVHDNLISLANQAEELISQTRSLQKQIHQSREIQKRLAAAKTRSNPGGRRLTGSLVTFKPVRKPSSPRPSPHR